MTANPRPSPNDRRRPPPRPTLAVCLALSVLAGCRRSPPDDPRAAAASPSAPVSTPRRATPTAPDLPAGPFRFRDRAEERGIRFIHTSGKSPEKHYPTLFGSGVALLDYDGDGLLDLYFADTRDLPLDAPSKALGNRLYRNRGGNSYEDVTDLAGVGFRGFSQGLAAGDFDGDGFVDLVLANLGPCVLYLNNGDGSFRDASKGSGLDVDGWWTSAAPLDYDGDGDLDLYVCRYSPWTFDGPHPECFDRSRHVRTVCSPTMLPADRHALFRNRGDGTFDDVTESAGVLRRDGRGLGVIAADLDLDGRVDLFVVNDLCPNFLFRNKGDGTFEDRTEPSGAARSGEGADQSGMGVDAEDLDGDGFPELLISHFRAEYATLYRNLRGRDFRDDSTRADLVRDSKPYVGWGCALADFDRDGEPDLMIVNGHVEDNLVELGRGIPQAEP
ncbi:MAG TPA: VCBS repeat-containing protein, partial [Isosphaeraceae bacterium]|nr:VCBS repeat-containing protein [Isosphaeraceae bacterium]